MLKLKTHRKPSNHQLSSPLTVSSVFFRVLKAQMEKMADPDSLAPMVPLVPLVSEE